MKKILYILTVIAALTLTTSCQKDLPDNMSNVVVGKGISSQTQTPVDTTQQGSIPAEEDNPMPVY